MAAVDLTRQSLLTTNTDPGARTNGTFPSEIITPTPSSSAPTQEAVPLEVKPPAEVDKALYQIEFHRKVYGASIDVLETLEKISFQDTYTDSTMRLNIAYLKYWRRGNTQPSAEKTTVVGADTKFGKVTNTKIEFDKNAKFPNTFEIKDIKGWTTLADGTVFKPLTNNKSTPINTAKSAPKVNEGPAPTTQPIDDLLDYRLPALPFTVGNIYQFVNKGQATVGQYGETALSGMNFVIGSDVSISAASAEDFPQVKRLPLTRVEALALLRAELNVAEAATPVDTELVKYLKDTLVKVEAATPEQYTQGLDLPPDPREDRLPTYEVPSQTETVRVADVVGGMDSQYKRYDPDAKVEKTEGIWQFLFNPQTLERSFGPEFKQANTWGNADGNPVHFSGFKNEELRFRDILLNGYMFGRKVESLVEGIRELVSVDVEKGHQSPRVLEFIWGSKTFGPCIMTDITVNEEMWDGGEVVNAKLNFTLKKIPEWLVNDEFVNIFDPVGQPLQQIIVQAAKPADTANSPTASVGETAPNVGGTQNSGVEPVAEEKKETSPTAVSKNTCSKALDIAKQLNSLVGSILVKPQSQTVWDNLVGKTGLDTEANRMAGIVGQMKSLMTSNLSNIIIKETYNSFFVGSGKTNGFDGLKAYTLQWQDLAKTRDNGYKIKKNILNTLMSLNNIFKGKYRKYRCGDFSVADWYGQVYNVSIKVGVAQGPISKTPQERAEDNKTRRASPESTAISCKKVKEAIKSGLLNSTTYFALSSLNEQQHEQIMDRINQAVWSSIIGSFTGELRSTLEIKLKQIRIAPTSIIPIVGTERSIPRKCIRSYINDRWVTAPKNRPSQDNLMGLDIGIGVPRKNLTGRCLTAINDVTRRVLNRPCGWT